MSQEVSKWADMAMYRSEEMPFDINSSGPRVTMLTCTYDPLGAIAAMSMMYEGRVARSLETDVSNDDRQHYFDQIKKTHLKAPFEAVSMHFMIEGVTRSFTHQMVRQRTAVYAQESLRFAVKEGFADEVALPPSLRSMRDDEPMRVLWEQNVKDTERTYAMLVDGGVPAEDARGLLPHNITTRLNYVTGLRGLQDHGGMRLCTQAQFEWRSVFTQIVQAIREYPQQNPVAVPSSHAWQYEEIANLFRPVCYLTGKCEFNASFDRACSIRERVELNHAHGIKSSEWDRDHWTGDDVEIPAINPIEWLGMPDAARVRSGGEM